MQAAAVSTTTGSAATASRAATTTEAATTTPGDPTEVDAVKQAAEIDCGSGIVAATHGIAVAVDLGERPAARPDAEVDAVAGGADMTAGDIAAATANGRI